MKAARLKSVDEDYRIHQHAFLAMAVTATKKSGKKEKYVYDKFKKFYDYEKELAKVEEEDNKERTPGRFDELSRFLKGQSDG